MNTDDLIGALSERLEPISPRAPVLRLAAWMGGGAMVSAVLMLWGLGMRPDMASAMGTSMFWTKFAYTLALGGLALWASERLGRPGVKARWPAFGFALVIVLFALIAGSKLAMAPKPMRHPMLMGHSAGLCPCLILALAIPLMIGAVLGLRGFAPTRPSLAGFAAGLSAGGLAAFVYAFSCNESAMPFVAVWYTLPVLLSGAIGALVGRFALRW
jgi:hypothetical protein